VAVGEVESKETTSFGLRAVKDGFGWDGVSVLGAGDGDGELVTASRLSLREGVGEGEGEGGGAMEDGLTDRGGPPRPPVGGGGPGAPFGGGKEDLRILIGLPSSSSVDEESDTG
jgi:hypothetical protein